MDSIDQRIDNNNRYNCPIDGCVYGTNGDKCFKRKLFLNQVRNGLLLNQIFC